MTEQQEAMASSDTFTTTHGITLRSIDLYKGLAKLNAAVEQLAANATDHAIVYDPITGLMESVRAPGFDQRLTHDDATQLASQLTFAGFSDWQLPNVPEGVHSVDYTREDPAADPLLYPDAVSAGYWTLQQTKWTEDEAGSSRSFFYVSMGSGNVNGNYANGQLRARPVRRAAPASQCLVLGQ